MSSFGAPEPRRPAVERLSTRSLLGWVVALGAAVWLSHALFPEAFPHAPGASWSLTRAEAIAIVEERTYDLGQPPDDRYVTAQLMADRPLELRLLSDQQAGSTPRSARETDLGQQTLTWLVTVYEGGAEIGEWTYRAEVGLDGTLLALVEGVPSGFSSPVQLSFEDSVSRADLFLRDLGFDLDRYFAPSERSVDVDDFTYRLLRYERRPNVAQADSSRVNSLFGGPNESGSGRTAPTGGIGAYGVEVRFAGDELKGFISWADPEISADFQDGASQSAQIYVAQFLVPFLLLPILGFVFARRYHLGLVGARRGTTLFVLILATGAVALLLTAGGISEGMDFGAFSRLNVTFAWIGLALVIYLPACALFAGLSAAVGESLAQGTWRSRWTAFDALLVGQWDNRTVATASLRGAAAGFLLLVGMFLVAPALASEGFFSPVGALLQPWWPSAAWPGLALLLVKSALVLTCLSFSLLYLLPAVAQRLGVLLGWLLAALVMAVCFAPPLATVPAVAGFPLAFLHAGIIGALFVRFGFLTALIAALVSALGPGALTLLWSGDQRLQLQGAGVLLVAVSPLIVSARRVLSARPYRYDYDDVPPHVRRIAERERQRVELETAKGIQASILPVLPSVLGGLEIAHHYTPASEVGGDFYDAIELEDGRLAVAIGDVAGHGVSSGLIMSMARSALTVQVRFDPSVEAVICALNRVVFESARRRLLTTLSYALYDPAQRTLSYACAGHLYPYRLRGDGSIEPLESTAYPLGVRAEVRPDCRQTELEPGDTIFLSSDGLVEAQRYGGEEMFGFERLEDSLRNSAGRDAKGVRDAVLESLEHFMTSGGSWRGAAAPAQDDLTIVVLRVPTGSE